MEKMISKELSGYFKKNSKSFPSEVTMETQISKTDFELCFEH